MQNNAILLQNLSIEQLQQLIGTSVRNGILELQKEIQLSAEKVKKNPEILEKINKLKKL